MHSERIAFYQAQPRKAQDCRLGLHVAVPRELRPFGERAPAPRAKVLEEGLRRALVFA